MTCRSCGTDIAEKAILCYRCGAPTAEPARQRSSAPAHRGVRAVVAFVVVMALIAAGVALIPRAPAGVPRILAYSALMLVTFVVLRLIGRH